MRLMERKLRVVHLERNQNLVTSEGGTKQIDA
jgi:hypothetical protein